MKKILIVEDEKEIANDLKRLLDNANYRAEILEDLFNAKDKILRSDCDLVLLDMNLPYINGEVLLNQIRKESEVPVIMVTSSNSEVDEVLSMSYGADDYITKPYNPTILLLRISNLFKRMQHTTDVLEYKGLKVNLSKGVITSLHKEVVLTKNELIIFAYLLNNKERIVSRDELMTDLWDNDEYVNDNALTVNISRLRSKLSSIGYDELIETRKGIGYTLN